MKTNVIAIPERVDDTSTVVAQALDVSTRYVRKVVNDKTYEPKSRKAKAKAAKIKAMYDFYKTGKNNLIRHIEQNLKIA